MIFPTFISSQPLVILILATAFFNFVIGAIVLNTNYHSRIKQLFAITAFLYGIWCIALVFYQHPIIFSSLFWIKITYMLVMGFMASGYLFSFVFPFNFLNKNYHRIGYIATAIYFIFCIWLLFFTNQWIYDVTITPQGTPHSVIGSGYSLWVLVTWSLVFWAIVNFIIKGPRSSKLEKIQMTYFWMGYFLFALFVNIPDVILPIFFANTDYFLLSGFASLFFTGATAYAILKHRFFDVSFVIMRSISYSIFIIILGTFYAAGFFVINSIMLQRTVDIIDLMTSTIMALIITYSFRSLLAFIEKTTDKIFHQKRYNETDLLHDLTRIMASKLRLADLTSSLLHRLLINVRISRGIFVLLEKNKIYHLTHEGYESKPLFSSQADLDILASQSVIVIFDELLVENPLKKLLRKLEISVLVPLQTQTKQGDFLILGEKLSGNPYTVQDIDLLEIFAPEAAIAIENASTVEKLMALDKAKGEFITVTSHQLRTPLSIARWNFEILFEGLYGKIPEKATVVLKQIYAAVLDLNRGLNNLMIIVEIEEKKSILSYEEAYLKQDILEPTKTALKQEIMDKNITITEDIAYDGIIRLDKQKIKKVMEALLENAIRYSPINSTIFVKVRAEKVLDKNQCVISVDDPGVGIIPQNQSFIFSRFFRGEEAKKISPNGFGLSLWIAKSLIELHRGQLWLGKKNAPGTIFYCTLPLT